MGRLNKGVRKTAFYSDLDLFIEAEKFSSDAARALVAEYKEIEAGISIEGFSYDYLVAIYQEYHDKSTDLVLMEKLAEAVFRDLSRHMRNPEARRVFYRISMISGTSAETEMFVAISNVRPLGHTNDGISAVTLVVADYASLKKLFAQEDGVEVIHLVQK